MENNNTGLWLLGTLVAVSIGAAMIMYGYSRPSKFPDIPGYQDYPSTGLFVDPAQQFAQARNTQRSLNIYAILNAVDQNRLDNRGIFKCAAGPLPATPMNLSSAPTGYDIAPCLVPTYLPSMPIDPLKGTYTTPSSYDTGYTIYRNEQGRTTVASPYTELGAMITVTR